MRYLQRTQKGKYLFWACTGVGVRVRDSVPLMTWLVIKTLTSWIKSFVSSYYMNLQIKTSKKHLKLKNHLKNIWKLFKVTKKTSEQCLLAFDKYRTLRWCLCFQLRIYFSWLGLTYPEKNKFQQKNSLKH